MQYFDKFYPGEFYHIYHRGNNKENIFIDDDNYRYFLKLWKKYICPIADTWSYCLLKNHFHVLVRIYEDIDVAFLETKQTSEVSKTSEVCGEKQIFPVDRYLSQQFSNLFNAYAKAINKRYKRTGSLFQTRFGRKLVSNQEYLFNLIHYIHFNPQWHKFTYDFKTHYYTSYHTLLSSRPTDLARNQVIELFGDTREFVEFHQVENDYKNINAFIAGDDP